MSKTMNRSRNQLASSYAPESFFTFEGGIGACIAKPVMTRRAELDADTREQIAARMDERIRSWYEDAKNCRPADKPSVLPRQCLEARLLTDSGAVAAFNEDNFVYLVPEEMGYVPAPLTFVCKTCKLVRTYDSVNHLQRDLDALEDPNACQHPKGKQGRCDWRQLDVVLVHWSGNWERMMPNQWHWDRNEKKAVLRYGRCTCDSRDFILDQSSPAIGGWYFRCASCNQPLSEKPFQNDRDTLEILGDLADDPANITVARMEAASYRASQTYYVQSDQFINFRDDRSRHLRLLLPSSLGELKEFIARQFGYARTSYTEADLEKAVKDAKREGEWGKYQSQVKSIATLEPMATATPALQETLDAMKQARDDLVHAWERAKIISPKVALPPDIEVGIETRATRLATRYDPFRLAVEHTALKETKLDPGINKGGRRAFVPFDRLDDDLSPAKKEDKALQESQTRQYLGQLGIETMGLIREFDLCRFSFGYSRMSPDPRLPNKRGMDMPVRLRLFPTVQTDDRVKHPVYVITQANEAFYVKLNEDLIYEWLRRLDCVDFFPRGASPGWRIGGGLLERTPNLDQHLRLLKRSPEGRVYHYVYTLLHTYAHVLIKQISEFSGLDLGSLGEYIFPADLAFVVYRSGTTMDLGNLSALWRNSNVAFLRSMLRTKTLECGSGSLCVHRGGACPDCIMIPETSCVAGNNLLSRSVLRGNGRPKLDDRTGPIEGFLDVANSSRVRKAA